MYQATELSVKISHDPQMTLPQYPRFSEDYLRIPVGEAGQEAMIIAGGEKPELLRGRAAQVLLPHLLPMLDGRHTIEEICRAFPKVKPQIIHDVVSLLYFRGLLEEGETAVDRSHFLPEERQFYEKQLRFFGRYTDVTRTSRNRYQTQLRLKEAAVLVLAAEHISERFAAQLIQAGVGRVTLLPPTAVSNLEETHLAQLNPHCKVQILPPGTPLATAVAGHTHLVAISNRDEESWPAVDDVCRAARVTWLRGIISNGVSEVGPLFVPDVSPSYRTFIKSIGPTNHSQQPVQAIQAHIGLSHIQLTILKEISRLFVPPLWNQVQTLNLENGEVSHQKVMRLPEAYAQNDQFPVLPNDLATLYHLETNHSWYGFSAKGHQNHYSASVTKMTSGAYKLYDTLPKLKLPPLESLPPLALDLAVAMTPQEPAPTKGKLDINKVSQICGWTGRWRYPEIAAPLRFIPSGGGMCSSDFYVVAWNVAGLAPGLYHYEGQGHQLEILREGDLRDVLRPFLSQADLLDETAMAIIQTAHTERLIAKYQIRGYRYAHLDAGIMLESFRLIANALGVTMHAFGRFADDDIARLLNIHPQQEVPMHVLLLSE